MNRAQPSGSAFLRSALWVHEDGWEPEQTLAWLAARRRDAVVEVSRVPFAELDGWRFAGDTGNLRHDSGRFFSIVGLKVETNWGPRARWTQPIIQQPEVGYLGMIVRRFGPVLKFLVQAKIEPGNIHHVQISPTLQATRSNYTRVHGGKAPLYLEYFNGERGPARVLFDQLQSEQGARFYRKRNRNIIIEVDEDLPVLDDFCWLSLGQIKRLLEFDNVVNMDTRTVIAGIDYGHYASDAFDLVGILGQKSGINGRYLDLLNSAIERDSHRHGSDVIISWMTELKSTYELDVERIALNRVEQWECTDDEIRHVDRKYFSVIGARIRISSREVHAWSQPLLRPAQEGLIAFVVKRLRGVYHFLVQAKVEAGNLDVLEMAPTVQCITGNYREQEYRVPFLEYVLQLAPERTLYKAYQSEEGGRFWQEQNLNLIVEAGDELDEADIPPHYLWLTLRQLNDFMKYNNYLNIQARSLLSGVRFVP